jgi:hypothetical protein
MIKQDELKEEIWNNKEFCSFIDNWIKQIDKRQNSFNIDDMRFIAVKGYQQAQADFIKMIDENNTKLIMKIASTYAQKSFMDFDEVKEDIENAEKELKQMLVEK